MIIQFTCDNYKSINEKIELSMIATKDTTHEDVLFNFNDNIQLLPMASIYGANGAGKSNIIKALSYFKLLVSQSINFQHGEPLPFYPHKLNRSKVSSFELQFIANNNKYAYGFSLNQEGITQEYLYHFPNGRQARIFEREKEVYTYGRDFQKELSEISDSKTKTNRLFLSTAASWSNLEVITQPFVYLKDNLVINVNLDNNKWLLYTIKKIQDDEEFKALFINLLKDLNSGVTDIRAKLDSKKHSSDELPNGMPEELKMFISKSYTLHPDVQLLYGDIAFHMEIDLEEESRGMRKIFEIGGPIIDILMNGKILIYDELETSIHPTLLFYIIKLFRNPQINKNNAQLIFTTHDTNLLDLDIFRRDEIWLVEKRLEGFSSDLYSLWDLKNVRKDENIEKGYILGKYGAIPFINDNLFKLRMEE